MPTSTRRKRPFYGGLPAKPRSFSILRRRGGRPCPPAGNARFYGNPMRIRNILKGGQSRPPLQMKFDRPFVSSNPVHQISVVPRYFRRGKSSGFANAGRIREIYILRRRGRCLHRPIPPPKRECPRAGAVGRYCIGFRFRAVGVDAHIDPPEMPGFTEIRCEIAALGFCQLPASSVQRMTGAPVQKSVPFCTVIFAPSIRFS